MGAQDRTKAQELFLASQDKAHAFTDIGCWDFEDGEAELVVGHVDDGHKRDVCKEVLEILKARGFAMTRGYHLPNGPLPKHTSNFRFDTPIGGLQEAFYLTLNESDLNEICQSIKRHK